MIAIKTDIESLPKYCDDCIHYECRPHPYKGWTEACTLCMQSMDDDAPKEWVYDGNGRPKKCPLIETEEPKTGKWIYQDDDDMRYDSYKCSECHKLITVDASRVDDIGFVIGDMKFCPNCGSRMTEG